MFIKTLMITQAKQFHQQAVRGYELQAIVDFISAEPKWFEVLYRPIGTNHVEHLFNNMSPNEKVLFDINLFTLLPVMQEKHIDKNLSVNLSPFSLTSQHFLNAFEHLITIEGINCAKLCIEVVETDELQPLSEPAHNLLKLFREKGGVIALDDFGGGYTHWELLHLKLVDILKVATQKFPEKTDNKVFTASAKFATNLGLQSVIEGIETAEEMTFAKNAGFDFCQGWLFNSWKQTA